MDIKTKPPIIRPNNLHFINWTSAQNWDLPFPDNSIDSIHIALVMGEIRGKGNKRERTVEDSLLNYSQILINSYRVLKPESELRIVEPRANAKLLRPVLSSYGFKEQSFGLLPDMGRTAFTSMFFNTFKIGGRPMEESYAVPMEIISIKQ